MNQDAATARAFFDQLERTQWLAPDALRDFQHEILARTLAHAAREVPAYRKRLAPVLPGGEFDPSRWSELPLLDKAELTSAWDDFQARSIPDNHGQVRSVSTSGSTGRPLEMRLTELENLARITASYRLMAWHGLDQREGMAMIRRRQAFQAPAGSVADECWGFLWKARQELGPRLRLDIERPHGEQLTWLAEQRPAYVNTLPSNLLALALEARREEREVPGIAAVVSVAELLTEDLRTSLPRDFGCELLDVYSSAEGGIVAHQCPERSVLHLQSELSFVEILDEAGRRCAAGEIGEVVLTPLYNFAMPLVRYRTGDLVMVGPTCACGRSLPVIERVLGRRRDLFMDGDGRYFRPVLDRAGVSIELGTLGWRVVQTGAERATLACAGAQASGRAAGVVEAIRSALPLGFSVAVERRDELAYRPGDKVFHFGREPSP